MKIVLDFRKYDRVVGGVEQGAIQIALNASKTGHSVVLVCKQSRLDDVRHIFGERPGLKIVPVDIKSHAISAQNAGLDSRFFQELARREKVDLIHFFYNWSFPFRKQVPSVLTVHDVIPFTFREAMGWFRNHFVYRTAIKTACRLNSMIATVSRFSAQDIATKVGVPAEKIRVVNNGLRTPAAIDDSRRNEMRKRYGLDGGFVLNVGGIHERKNIPGLIRAFAGLVKDHGYTGRLVITGNVSRGDYQKRMKKICDTEVRRTGMGDRIVFTGFIDDDDLDVLLDLGELLVYPSFYEGFGIPILEAMRAGTPVVTSNVTAMPEVAGDAAVLVDPSDIEAMTSGMANVLKDDQLRARLIENGKRHVAGYSWERNWKEYLAVYEEVLRTPVAPMAPDSEKK